MSGTGYSEGKPMKRRRPRLDANTGKLHGSYHLRCIKNGMIYDFTDDGYDHKHGMPGGFRQQLLAKVMQYDEDGLPMYFLDKKIEGDDAHRNFIEDEFGRPRPIPVANEEIRNKLRANCQEKAERDLKFDAYASVARERVEEKIAAAKKAGVTFQLPSHDDILPSGDLPEAPKQRGRKSGNG